MSSPINKLPPEVLFLILDYVRQPSSASLSSHSSVLSCLLCCKAWYTVTLPMIYRNIVLRIHNSKCFTDQFLQPFSRHNHVLQLIQSLTISLNPKDYRTPPGPIAERNEKIKNQCFLPLEKLPSILIRMTHLTTLSIIIASGGRYDLRKDMMGSILAALPESCINLELDLDPVNLESKGPGSAHICEMISPHLSRLHHLRLEIGTICPALFGNHFAIDGSLQREHPPPLSDYYYPALQTFIINCNFRGSALTCNINGANVASNALPPARVALVQCLRHLFLRGSFPRIQRLWLLDGQLHDPNDESVYAAWNRRDIVNNKTWAIPWVDVKGPTPMSFYSVIRTPEGRELVTPSQYRSVFAEDQTWKETTLGSRFPAAVLADQGDFIVRDPPALSVSEYRSLYKGSCLAWRHEQMTGRKLLWATEREGLVDRSPLHEITPPGWRRGIGYEGAICGFYPDNGSTGS